MIIRSFLLLTFFISNSFAYKIEDIVILDKADELELSEEISDTDLANTTSSSMDDVLRETPFATTLGGPRSTSEAPQVRGLSFNKTYLYIDGVKQSFRTDHSSMVPVDMDDMKSVAIDRNSSDFSKNGSLGGGVSLVTKDVNDYLQSSKKKGAELLLRHSSANSEKTINIKGMYKDKGKSTLIKISNKKANDIQLNDNTTLNKSSFEDNVLQVKHKFKNYNLQYDLFHRNDMSPLNPSLDAPLSINSLHGKAKTIRNTFKFTKKNFSSSVNSQILKKTRAEDNSFEKRSILSLNLSYKKESYGADLYADFLESQGSNESLNSYPKAQSYRSNIFYQQNSKLGIFDLGYGLRGNIYALNGEQKDLLGAGLSKKVSLSLKSEKKSELTFLYSEGFNAPRVNNVYPDGLHHAGDGFFIADNFFIPNTDLKHETSQNYELIYRAQLRPTTLSLFKVDLRSFYTRAKDYIYFEKIDRAIVDGINGTTQFVNLKDVSLYGYEAKISFLTQSFETSLAYSSLRGKNRERNLYLAELPADQLNFKNTFNFEQYGLSFGYLGIYTYKQDRINLDSSERTDATGSYYTYNIFARKRISTSFELGLKVDNMGNKRYRKHGSNIYESKEDIKIELKYKINTI